MFIDPTVENDTLARIGTSCLQQLLESNVKKLSPARWDRVATTFVKLFKTTTPHQLFDESLRIEIDGSPELQEGPGTALLCFGVRTTYSTVSQKTTDRPFFRRRCRPMKAASLVPKSLSMSDDGSSSKSSSNVSFNCC